MNDILWLWGGGLIVIMTRVSRNVLYIELGSESDLDDDMDDEEEEEEEIENNESSVSPAVNKTLGKVLLLL